MPASFKCFSRADISLSTAAVGPGLLLLALAFNAYFLWPEVWIGRVPVNDSVFHLAASERLLGSLLRGEPFLDPWVSEWSLGYPLWQSYQPLPHFLAAVAFWIASPLASTATTFATLEYILILSFPASVYFGSRLLGFKPSSAGLASLLVFAPTGVGELGRFGLGYGATTWYGSGLYTQVVALHFLILAVGLVAHSLDTGKRQWIAAILLTCTALSHIVFGYVAFVSAVLVASVGPFEEFGKRVARLFTILIPGLVLLVWFLVPLCFSRSVINQSVWEPNFKWDSFGAPIILRLMFSGNLLDAQHFPVFSIFICLAVVSVYWRWNEALPRRLVVLTSFWLLAFFGRATWGHLIALLGVPSEFHLHRLQAAFELAIVLLTAWGLGQLVEVATTVHRWAQLAGVFFIAIGLVYIGYRQVSYLTETQARGYENLVAYQNDKEDLGAALADAQSILDRIPGRISAGKSDTWAGNFKVGSAPVYSFLTRGHFDQVSYLYHSMSRTSDIMILRDEEDSNHDKIFGIRAVIAPANQVLPKHLKHRATHGRFAVYESSPEGYFSLVDIAGQYSGDRSNFDINARWLTSGWAGRGAVIALNSGAADLPIIKGDTEFPSLALSGAEPRGSILSEKKNGETYSAVIDLNRPGHVLVKITWHPDLIATVDGSRVPVLHVTPGFAAIAAPAGQHRVELLYAPGLLKPVLLITCMALAFLCFLLLRLRPVQEWLVIMTDRLFTSLNRLLTPRVLTGLGLLCCLVLALHAFFRGILVEGHDALSYPARFVEMYRALADAHIPPIWAPDLGAGYGQPLFEFLPPLAFVAALPAYCLGASLADSLQSGLVVLVTAGAIALYRIGRLHGYSRAASAAGSIMWLFSPYLLLDLFVRGEFAEGAALAIVPVALLGTLRAIEKPTVARIAQGAIAVALVPLGHNAASLLVLPALGIVVLFHGFAKPLWRSLIAGAATLLGGLGLSAYFWIPALLEKEFVKVELLRQDFFHWANHLISPSQLIWSKWGYGLSVPGPGDGMSFSLGILHIFFAGIGALLLFRSKSPVLKAHGFSAVFIIIFGSWLATDLATSVWSNLGYLQYLMFPWRVLLLPTLFLPLVAMAAFERMRRWACGVSIILLIVVNLPKTEPSGFVKFDDSIYSYQSIAQSELSVLTREEYEPRWVRSRPRFMPERLAGANGDVRSQLVTSAATRHEFMVEAAANVDVEATVFYYPGWTVTVDGASVPIVPSAGSGTIQFHLTKGVHKVVLQLLATPIRAFALFLSGLTLSIIVLCMSLKGAQNILSQRQYHRPFFLQGTAILPAVLILSLTVGLTRDQFNPGKLVDAVREVNELSALPVDSIGARQVYFSNGPSAKALMNIGMRALYCRKEVGLAGGIFRLLIDRNPHDFSIKYHLAAALEYSGRAQNADRPRELVFQKALFDKYQQFNETIRKPLDELQC